MATSSIQTKFDVGNDTYDTALQRTMHTVLPPILMEIADFRPSDPIQFLAQRLHEFRTREDRTERSNIKVMRSPIPCDINITDSFTNLVIQDTDTKVLPHSLRQSSGLDDFEKNSCTKVHNEVLNLLDRIGDIFDDSDIT